MDMFATIRTLYLEDLFTDVNIYVTGQSEKVVSCHKLVIASIFPELLHTLRECDEEATTSILIEDVQAEEIKQIVDRIYFCLQEGTNPRCNEIDHLFGLNKPKANLAGRLKQARGEVNFDTNLFEYECFEEISMANDKYLSVQLQRHRKVLQPKMFQYCALFALSRSPQGTNLASLLVPMHQTDSRDNDKGVLKLLQVIPSLLQIPMSAILEQMKESLEEPKSEDGRTSFDLINKPHATSHWIPLPLIEQKLSFKIVDFSKVGNNVFDLAVIYGNDVGSLKICSYLDKKTLDGMESHSDKARLIVETMSELFQQDPMEIPVFESLCLTHFKSIPSLQKLPDTSCPKTKTQKSNISFSRELPDKSIPQKEANLKCDHEGCKKKFNNKAAWRKHVNYFHLKEGVPCDECGLVYQNFFYLRCHRKQSHDEVQCKDCHELFIGENELGRHKRKAHLKGNEHICEICGQGFKMKFYLKRHKRQHHPHLFDSPYTCSECNRYFGTNRKLKDHITGTHLKTRPYRCRAGDQVCNKAFFNVNLRRKHEKQVHQLHIFTPKGTQSSKILHSTAAINQPR